MVAMPPARPRRSCRIVDLTVRILLRELRREFAGTFSEDDEIGERVTAKSIRAIDSRGALTGGK